MFTVVKYKDPANEPTPKPGSLVPTKHSLIDPGTGNAIFGWDGEEEAKGEALRMARTYPGLRYDVFELVLLGSAQTPIATWVAAKTVTEGVA